MNFSPRIKIIAMLSILILAIGTVYLFFLPSGNEVMVTITHDSFEPNQIVIKKGDTVRWVNKSGEPAWPASNLHPTHELYPEFDPRSPTEPNQEWSFTFRQKGEWRYHDHLLPRKRGIIIVE